MDVLMATGILILMGVYGYLGARFARQTYTKIHHQWFDEKIAERRASMSRKKPESPEETLRVLRKRWANGPGAQGEAIGLAIAMFIVWPAFKPLFSLSEDPEPSSEEQKLIIATQEAEIERLRRQHEESL